ncbi:MAG: hypothetical protein J6T04_08700 [Bacteroidales bacterium]|nr:hypothetical protein [Bacteroidales bacterium]
MRCFFLTLVLLFTFRCTVCGQSNDSINTFSFNLFGQQFYLLNIMNVNESNEIIIISPFMKREHPDNLKYFFFKRINDFSLFDLIIDEIPLTYFGVETFMKKLRPNESFTFIFVDIQMDCVLKKTLVIEQMQTVENFLKVKIPDSFLYSPSCVFLFFNEFGAIDMLQPQR